MLHDGRSNWISLSIVSLNPFDRLMAGRDLLSIFLSPSYPLSL